MRDEIRHIALFIATADGADDFTDYYRGRLAT